MQTIVLDACFHVVDIINSLEALVKVITNKAEALIYYKDIVRSTSASFKLPRIIKLPHPVNHMICIPYSKKNVMKRDNYICQYCSKQLNSKSATIDHIIPRSKGGKNNWVNTVVACRDCNCKKGSMLLEDTDMTLLQQPTSANCVDSIMQILAVNLLL